MKSSTQRFLIAAVVVLLAVSAAAGGYAYRLHQELELAQSSAGLSQNDAKRGANQPAAVNRNWFDREPMDLFKQPGPGGDWDPLGEMRRMREEMDRIFGDSFARLSDMPAFDEFSSQESFQPRIDIQEQQKQYTITVDVPGAEESTVDVAIEDGRLIVSGSTGRSTEDEQKAGSGGFIHRERFFGSFKRVVPLPEDAEHHAARHEYRNGVITVIIPKTGRHPA